MHRCFYFNSTQEVNMRPLNLICGIISVLIFLPIRTLSATINVPGDQPTIQADVNNNGTVNIFDITFLISYLYLDGPASDCP